MNQTLALSAVYTAVDKMTGPVRKMTGSVNNFDNGLKKSGQNLRDWGARVGAMSVIASEGGNIVKRVASDMGQPFFELDRKLGGLERNIKSSGQNQVASMQAAKKAAQEWERVHNGSAAAYIEMTDKMSAAGFKDVDAIRATRQVLTLATGTMSDASTASEILVYSYQQLGDKTKSVASEMKKHADMTAKVQQVYSMRGLGEFTDAMKDALPAASLMRQKYEEVAVAVGTLQRAGWQGGKAGGSYASILSQMEKASGELGFTMVKSADGALDFVATVDKISGKYGDLRKITPQVREELKAAFGDDGIRMLMVFQQQSGQMKKSMDDLRNSTGEAAKMRDQMENKGFGKMEKYLQRFNSIKTNAAEKIFGDTTIMDKVIPRFLDGIEGVVNFGIAFANANPEITTLLLTLLAGGAAALFFLAPLVTIAGGLMTMGGMALTVAGHIGTLLKFVGSGAAWRKAQAYIRLTHIRYMGFSKCVTGCLAPVKTFGSGILAMGKNALFAGAKALPGMIAGVWKFTVALLANPMTWVVLGIMALIGAIALCIIYWDDISAAAGKAWAWIKSTASAGMDFLQTLPGRYLEFLGSIGQSFFDAGAKLWTTFADGIASVVSAPLGWIRQGMALIDEYLPHSDARKGPLSRLTESGRRLMTTFADGMPQGFSSVQNAVGKGLDLLENIKPLSLPFSLDNMLQSGKRMMGNLAKDMPQGFDAVKKAAGKGMDLLENIKPLSLPFSRDNMLQSGKRMMGNLAKDIPQSFDVVKNAVGKGMDLLGNIKPLSLPFSADSALQQGKQMMDKIIPARLTDWFDVPDPDDFPDPFPVGGQPGNGGRYIDQQDGLVNKFIGEKGQAFHFHAPITIKVEKMDNPEDFMGAMRVLAMESGAI